MLRDANVLAPQDWLEDGHLDMAIREMRSRLRSRPRSIIPVTPCLVEHWFQYGNDEMAVKLDTAPDLKCILLPISNSIGGNSGSHWTLSVLQRCINQPGSAL